MPSSVTRWLPTLALFAATAGCAGSDTKPPPAPASSPAAVSAKPATNPHLPPGLAAFDRAFAPLWQGAAGDRRRELVCVAIDDLTIAADELATGEVPVAGRDREIAWQRDAELLARAVEELAAACETGGGFEPALGQVNDRYHALAERLDPGRPTSPLD
jgi:hypothetical protein